MIAWTSEQRAAFFAILAESWPGEFNQAGRAAWTVMLDGIDPMDAVQAIRRMLRGGKHKWRPSVAEFFTALDEDPCKPTFAEAYRLIFGQGGVLAARPERRVWPTDLERRRGRTEAAERRAEEMHPLVASFVARQGVERLRGLRVDHPEWGTKTRADLERDWDRHVEAMRDREAVALASGGRKGELGKLDPLAALDGGVPRLLEERAA